MPASNINSRFSFGLSRLCAPEVGFNARSVFALVDNLPRRLKRKGCSLAMPDPEGAGLLDKVAKFVAWRFRNAPGPADAQAGDLTCTAGLSNVEDEIVHFCGSGNAPELRHDAETSSATHTDTRLGAIMPRLTEMVSSRPD